MGFYNRETERIYCGVRVEFFSLVKAILRLQTHISTCENYGGQNGAGTGSFSGTSDFYCQNHSASASYTPSTTRCSYQKDKRAKLVKLPKAMLLENRGNIRQKVCLHLIQ